MGYCFLIAGIGVLVLAIWMGRRGTQFLARLSITNLELVTGTLPHETEPADVETITNALMALNRRGLPYRVDQSIDRRGRPVFTVRTRVEEVRWREFLRIGSSRTTWGIRVTLKPGGHYTWHETHGTVIWDANAKNLSVSYQRSWFSGRVAGPTVTTIWAPDQPGSTTAQLSAGDIKIPVFSILRAYGWRPRFDWWGTMMFER